MTPSNRSVMGLVLNPAKHLCVLRDERGRILPVCDEASLVKERLLFCAEETAEIRPLLSIKEKEILLCQKI